MSTTIVVSCDWCSWSEEVSIYDYAMSTGDEIKWSIWEDYNIQLNPDGEELCELCWFDNYFYCDSCGEDMHKDNLAICEAVLWGEPICEDCSAIHHHKLLDEGEMDDCIEPDNHLCLSCGMYVWTEDHLMDLAPTRQERRRVLAAL